MKVEWDQEQTVRVTIYFHCMENSLDILQNSYFCVSKWLNFCLGEPSFSKLGVEQHLCRVFWLNLGKVNRRLCHQEAFGLL